MPLPKNANATTHGMNGICASRSRRRKNRIRKIFGDDAAKLGFAPIAAEEPLQLLNAIAEQTARGFITSATINVRGLCKAKITMTTKEKIKVERSETKTYQLEE